MRVFGLCTAHTCSGRRGARAYTRERKVPEFQGLILGLAVLRNKERKPTTMHLPPRLMLFLYRLCEPGRQKLIIHTEKRRRHVTSCPRQGPKTILLSVTWNNNCKFCAFRPDADGCNYLCNCTGYVSHFLVHLMNCCKLNFWFVICLFFAVGACGLIYRVIFCFIFIF